MRCKLCHQKAIYEPLRFCKGHFLAYYVKKVRHYLESTHTRDVSVLVGVSGGKDSGALVDALAELKEEFSLGVTLFTIDLAIPDYSEKGLTAVRALSERYGLPLIVEELRRHPRSIPDFAGPGRKPCAPCGTIKRFLLNKAAWEGGFDYVATGHNLDDEFFFAMHNLLHRSVDQLRRLRKRLPPRPEHRLAGRLKPLYYLTEKENRLYCLLKGIPHDADECPFSEGNPQLLFKERFASIGRDEKRNLLKSVERLQEPAEEVVSGEDAGQLHPCPRCGYATIGNAACVFCRLMDPDAERRENEGTEKGKGEDGVEKEGREEQEMKEEKG